MEKYLNVNQPRLPSGRVILIIVLVLLILALLVWLLTLFNQIRELEEAFEPEYFARDQVLVSGPPGDVARVVLDVTRTLGITLVEVMPEPLEVPDFLLPRSPAGDVLQESAQIPGEPVSGEEFLTKQTARLQSGQAGAQDDDSQSVVVLYRIIDNRSGEARATVVEVVNAINDTGTALGVVSDPNYVIGRTPIDLRNSQRTEGDPNSSEGFAVSPPAGSSGVEEFYNQWAFHSMTSTLTNSVGIELFAARATSVTIPPPRTVPTATGAGTLVAIFDTSPFDLQGLPLSFTGTITVVNHHEVVGIPDVRDHGIFIASLIAAVAPDSDIRLYRVLNESNQGDLETLLRALDALINDQESSHLGSTQPLSGTVINLSLGVHEDPDLQLSSAVTVPVPTLYQKLNHAHDLGAVIVAAAGNDSADSEPDSPVEAQVPASYSFIIGVGASNVTGDRACFSNGADVYAPGGDNDANCTPAIHECLTNPALCIIGYSVHVSPHSHYAYWNGTSFATPLVSGQVALLLERKIPPAQVKQHIIDTAIPMSSLNLAQGTGGRIINIPASVP